MSLDISKLRNEFLKTHLAYVDQTEAPIMFHLWAAIGCVSACMGRHLYIETDLGKLFGNMYVLLVGPPSTKKNTAINLAARIMRTSTEVRWAPDDTGGQRQGLISAFVDGDEEVDETGLDIAEAADIETIAATHVSLSRPENKHCMVAIATEFGSFLGQNNQDLCRFLIKIWDGEDYDYKIKNQRHVLYNPLFALIGGTTPTDIATLLPPEAMGGGFTSRFLLIYAGNKAKQVPPSQIKLRGELEPHLANVYRRIWFELRGAMALSTDAAKLLDRIYLQDHKIEDTRFIYYVERRDTHLRKLSMCLAAARGSIQIDLIDVYDAELILKAVERYMPDALGEYGLSPLSVARQKMLEYLRYAGEPVSNKLLWAIMQKDMKLIDFQNTLSSLCVADRITALDIEEKGRYYIFNDVKEEVSKLDEDVLEALLAADGLSTSTKH